VAPLDGKVEWKIADNTGRVVMQQSAHLKKGNNNLVININRLSAGLYYLAMSVAGIDQKVKLQKS